ncbi:ABC transporter permease, partial [Candidatus Bipolaricaulota bacterium]|nr:ABC transporter permease [Candidatus Bipolaricaulota bacterium]
DVEAIARVDGVDAVTTEHRRNDAVAWQGERISASLRELRYVGKPFLAGELLRGRLPTAEEVSFGAHVALVGPNTVDRGFEGVDPIGQEIMIADKAFRVIGVFRAPASDVAFSSDGGWNLYIPEGALERPMFFGLMAWVELDPKVSVETTVAGIAEVLHARHPDAAPAGIGGPASEAGEFIDVINGITYGVLRLAALAVVLSAVALATLSWSRARRLRRVYGIRRSQGATALGIFWRALRSAVLATTMAGAVALGIAYLAIELVEDLIQMPLQFDPVWFAWTAGAALVATVLGGGIPAWRAARWVPAETIRSGRE